MKQLRGYTVGSIAPSNPQPGDRWHELSLQGVSLCGWDWIYSAGRWVSPMQKESASVNFISQQTAIFFDPQQTIQLIDFQALLFVGAQGSSSWQIQLLGLMTSSPVLSSAGIPVNTFTRRSVTIAGIETNPSIQILFVPQNSPPPIAGCATFRYQFVRT